MDAGAETYPGARWDWLPTYDGFFSRAPGPEDDDRGPNAKELRAETRGLPVAAPEIISHDMPLPAFGHRAPNPVESSLTIPKGLTRFRLQLNGGWNAWDTSGAEVFSLALPGHSVDRPMQLAWPTKGVQRPVDAQPATARQGPTSYADLVTLYRSQVTR